MSKLNSLLNLKINEIAIIDSYNLAEIGSTRLQEMGLIPGNKVRLIKKAPFNGPIEIKLKGFYLSLRRDIAGKIKIKKNEYVSK